MLIDITAPLKTRRRNRESNVAIRYKQLAPRRVATLLRKTSLYISTARPCTIRTAQGVQTTYGATNARCHHLLQPRDPLPTKDVIFTSTTRTTKFLTQARKGILLTAKTGRLSTFTILRPTQLFPHILPAQRNVTTYRKTSVPRGGVVTVRKPFSCTLGQTLVRRFTVHFLIAGSNNTTNNFRRGTQTTRSAKTRLVIVHHPTRRNRATRRVLARYGRVLR